MLSAEQDGFLVLIIGLITLLFTVLLITFALMVNFSVNREIVSPTLPVRAVKPLWPRPRYPFLTPSGHTATQTPLPDIRTPSVIDEPSLPTDGAPYPAPYGTPTLDDSLSSELPPSAIPIDPLLTDTPVPSNQALPALTPTPVVLLTNTTTNTPVPSPSIVNSEPITTTPTTSDEIEPTVIAPTGTNAPASSPLPSETNIVSPTEPLLATASVDGASTPSSSSTSTTSTTPPTTINTSTISPPSATTQASDTATSLPLSATVPASDTATSLPPSATVPASDTATSLPLSATVPASDTATSLPLSATALANNTPTALPTEVLTSTATLAPGSTPYPPPPPLVPTLEPYN